jgi:murein L,D-transpeptidase YcbB/YkuD
MKNSKSNAVKILSSFPFVCWIVIVLIHISWNAIGQENSAIKRIKGGSSYVYNQNPLKNRSLKDDPGLKYPTSVERFYKEKEYQLQWVGKDHYNPQTGPAMMLLDCVQQFGLDQRDFHPDEINYDKLQLLRSKKNLATEKERETFDVQLTDAMITFMNYLHYGKFNVNYSSIKTDWDSDSDFNAVKNLIAFLYSKDFFTAMTSVQPASKAYDDLQKYMRLVRGQYMEDNYEFSEEKVQKMAINMERLRWNPTEAGNHIVVNLPSKGLKFYTADSIYNYKTVIGSTDFPTPTLVSRIKHFTIAPVVKVPGQLFISEVLPMALKNLDYLHLNHYEIYNDLGNIVLPTHNKLTFIQKNPLKYFAVHNNDGVQTLKKVVIYFGSTSVVNLHDVSSVRSRNDAVKSVADFGIGVKEIKQLTMLLLEKDSSGQKVPRLRKAFETYNLVDFKLNKAVPVVITYVTCEIVDGQLVIYNDVYQQDQALLNKMYPASFIMIAELKK